MRKNPAIFVGFFLSVFLFPQAVFGQLVITEIAYDVSGSDEGREWIEIQNVGATAVSLSSWKLVEDGARHGLVSKRGGSTIPSNGYAIISSKVESFLADWPNFSGILLDSSFSLKNTGETLSLVYATSTTFSDTVTYSNDQGANGNGFSLQKFGSVWKEAPPTPGSINVEAPIVEKKEVPKAELAPPILPSPTLVAPAKTKPQPEKVTPKTTPTKKSFSPKNNTASVVDSSVEAKTIVVPKKDAGISWLWLLLPLIIISGLLALFLRPKETDDEITIIE